MKTSIQERFSYIVLVQFAVVMALAVSAIASLMSVNQKFEDVDQKWLATTGMLGELADRISEFRLAETYRALANTAETRAAAEKLASDQSAAIGAILRDYVKLNSATGSRDVADIQAAWSVYLSKHREWVASDETGAIDEPALYKSALHQLGVRTRAVQNRTLRANGMRTYAASLSLAGSLSDRKPSGI
ncbi:MCP four helix bundle domain-containing protein [Oryzifoliimicrobium ureilyticus]|uniref:MCP four helix bundle domain-containing protein n=1 Tax=Oryzifoliimicrobium ureilyticus TaxID=3113724 RepID=UPI0030761252